MNILGISAFYHDSAACLVQDGRIVAAAQEERFSRVKHDFRFPTQAVEYCLREAGLGAEQLDYIAFYEKPWIKFERLLETYLTYAPSGLASFLKSMPLWLKEKLWIGDKIKSELPGYNGNIIYTEHHQSHAAAAFFPSPFERAAILTNDGVGEWATASWGTGRDNKFQIGNEMRFPHSLGLLYSAFTHYLGFKVNSGEYKVMGLAPYGQPKYVQTILDNMIDLKEDSSFRLNMDYFNYCQGLTMTSDKFHRLFEGSPRQPESDLTQKDMDLARSLQEVTGEIMLRQARHLRHETGEKNLCLAGGVALNCVANGQILRQNIFDQIWIQPAAGDAGGALGAALFTWYQLLGNNRRTPENNHDFQQGSCLGPSWNSNEINNWLKNENYPAHRHEENAILEKTAEAISSGKVIGWFSGRMEYGPRALGDRSIIGDARDPDMQTRINLKVKKRESFRPFAPAVLAEDTAEYFDLDRESPYMMLVSPVHEKHLIEPTEAQKQLSGLDRLKSIRSDIPAVTHIDYSARVQTVNRHDNPRFHALISRFREKTGCGVIINTSFNRRGEPIVCSPEDAYNCFMQTEIDLLVLEDFILYKEEQPAPTNNNQDKDKTDMPAKKTKAELRNYGLTMATVLALMGSFMWWLEKTAWPVPAGLALIFLLSALVRPKILAPIEWGWMKAAEVLGRMMTGIILTVAFYTIITIPALFMRIIGRDPLYRKFDHDTNSYWIAVKTDDQSGRPDKPF
ncbi:MAG: carbamoyltransferase [FCB group bacterium]|nr:carbamoyltransferase [FCB group bacterium]